MHEQMTRATSVQARLKTADNLCPPFPACSQPEPSALAVMVCGSIWLRVLHIFARPRRHSSDHLAFVAHALVGEQILGVDVLAVEEDELTKAPDALPCLGKQCVEVDGRRHAAHGGQLARICGRGEDMSAAVETACVWRALLRTNIVTEGDAADEAVEDFARVACGGRVEPRVQRRAAVVGTINPRVLVNLGRVLRGVGSRAQGTGDIGRESG